MSCAEPAPDEPARGSDVDSGLVLTLPDGALPDSGMRLTIEELAVLPRGAVRAWELGPDGTKFAEPVRLEAEYGDFELPPGVDSSTLRLSVYVDERWVALADSENDVDKKVVRATTTHFSIYGLVPDPKQVDGRGMLWEANGVSVTADAEHFARLSASPTAISLFLSGEQAGTAALSLSGLPTQGTHHLYVDSLEDHRLVTPADAGQVSLSIDGARSHYLWLQPSPGTVHIGGTFDQCASVGSWSGNVCRLSADIVGGVSIEAPDVVLDCDGHRISQEFADRGMGVGVLVTETRQLGFPSDITVQNCVVGGTDQWFWEGVAVFSGTRIHVLDSVFEDNAYQLKLISGSEAEIVGNSFLRTLATSVLVSEDATNGVIANNAMTPGMGEPEGVVLQGMIAELGLAPVSNFEVVDNTINSFFGIRLSRTSNISVVGNFIKVTLDGLRISPDAVMTALRHNTIEAGRWGAASNQSVELSDAGEGNWWGHDCPEPPFVPGVDSNRADVVDSFAYGRRDAWELGLEPGCDTTPPVAPVILSPVNEEGMVFFMAPVILGRAEPFSQVKIFEGTTELGAGYATSEEDFVVSLSSLMSGQHVIHSVAIDRSGNESVPSAPLSFGILVIDEGNPISAENGKFSIVGLSVSPNPFDPTTEINQLHLALDVDAVRGLGGNSQNHRLFALTARVVMDPETLEPITTIYAASEIEGDNNAGPARVTVIDQWNGCSDDGCTIAKFKAYPSDLTVAVVRLYAGNGNGPQPSLKPGEFLTHKLMSEIMKQVLIDVTPTDQFDPRVFIDVVRLGSTRESRRYTLQPLVLDTWPPSKEELVNFVLEVLTRDGFDGRYDTSVIGSAIALNANELAGLFRKNGFEYYGIEKSWFEEQYLPRGAAAVGILMPGAGIEPGRGCDNGSDILVMVFDSESLCDAPGLQAAFIGMAPCDSTTCACRCGCASPNPTDCNPEYTSETGEYDSGGENCQACYGSTSCSPGQLCTMCWPQ